MDPEYYEIGPGIWGFIATFGLAVAVILLGMSLTRHLRKVRMQSQAQASDAAIASGSVKDGDSGGDVVANEAGNGE